MKTNPINDEGNRMALGLLLLEYGAASVLRTIVDIRIEQAEAYAESESHDILHLAKLDQSNATLGDAIDKVTEHVIEL